MKIGNILLVIAVLAFLLMLRYQLGLVKSPGGDAAVGNAYVMFIIFGFFIVSLLLIVIYIGWNGGFEWVADTSVRRILIVVGSILLIVVSLYFVVDGNKLIWKSFDGLYKVVKFVPIVFGVLVLFSLFVFLNPGKLNAPYLLKGIPILLVGISALLLFISVIVNPIYIAHLRKVELAKNGGIDENDQRIIDDIEACDLTKNMVFILGFAGDNQDKIVREKALSKIKSIPNWQEVIVDKLQSDWAPEAFQFLASNNVDSLAMFLQPLQKGISIQAKLISDNIRNASYGSNIDADIFGWEVEAVIRTVDRFDGMGVDYVPAIKNLRKAFDTRSEADKPKFRAIAYLDKWIKKHGG